MYVEIKAVDADRRDSPGKTSYLNTEDFELSIGEGPAEHLGKPKQFLQLTAVDTQ